MAIEPRRERLNTKELTRNAYIHDFCQKIIAQARPEEQYLFTGGSEEVQHCNAIVLALNDAERWKGLLQEFIKSFFIANDRDMLIDPMTQEKIFLDHHEEIVKILSEQRYADTTGKQTITYQYEIMTGPNKGRITSSDVNPLWQPGTHPHASIEA